MLFFSSFLNTTVYLITIKQIYILEHFKLHFCTYSDEIYYFNPPGWIWYQIKGLVR